MKEKTPLTLLKQNSSAGEYGGGATVATGGNGTYSKAIHPGKHGERQGDTTLRAR